MESTPETSGQLEIPVNQSTENSVESSHQADAIVNEVKPIIEEEVLSQIPEIQSNGDSISEETSSNDESVINIKAEAPSSEVHHDEEKHHGHSHGVIDPSIVMMAAHSHSIVAGGLELTS